MNILFTSCHSVLEFDELQLLTDLGHDCFALGSYHSLGHSDLPRPAVKGLKYHEDLDKIYTANPVHTDIDQRIIDWADAIIVMHSPDVIVQNWEKFKHKIVIWRSIGQSVPNIEDKLAKCRAEGLKIVRYSPKEALIPRFIGEDAMIRFYKDPNEYPAWTGDKPQVVSFAQSLLGRRNFCHYDEIMAVIHEFNGKVYGPGNEDLGKYNGGQVPYEQQIKIMQESRAMPYAGTWPAPYTLSFIEAMMAGLPIVAISKTLAHYPQYEQINFYEVDEILGQISGIVCETPEDMVKRTAELLNDPEHAFNISQRQRDLAIDMFGKKVISAQWQKFLDGLV